MDNPSTSISFFLLPNRSMSNQSIQPFKPHRHLTAAKAAVKATVNVEAWDPCQPGTLTATQSPFMFERLSRRMAIFQMSIIYLMGMLTVYSSFLAFTSQPAAEPKLPPDLSCDLVQSLLVDYTDQTLSNRRVRESVAFHLAHCAHCDREYQSMIGEDVDLVRRSGLLPADGCHCCADADGGSCQSSQCVVHACEPEEFQLERLHRPEFRKSKLGSKPASSCQKEKKEHNDRVEPCIVP